MKVLFRSLEDGSHVTVDCVSKLIVRSNKYEVHFHVGCSSYVSVYNFCFYSFWVFHLIVLVSNL